MSHRKGTALETRQPPDDNRDQDRDIHEREGPRAYVVRRVVGPVQQFINTEAFSGAVLLAAAVTALVWANSPWDDEYFDLFSEVLIIDVGVFRIEEDLQHWINDFLMTFFFFVVGLEIKRELWRGELTGLDRALLPCVAALGGMIAPALIYFAINAGGDGADGWGIPMATDIAFALGLVALLGRRIPTQLRIFLLALAIVDDIGAILVIAVFYSSGIEIDSLVIAGLLLVLIYMMNRAGVRELAVYFLVGGLVWVAVFESGVQATITGVVLGLMTPLEGRYSPRAFQETMRDLMTRFRSAQEASDSEAADQVLAQMEEATEGTEAPLDRLERLFHPFTSYLIVPLFALANAGVVLDREILEDSVTSSVTIGVVAGLVIGKPLGIFVFSWFAVRSGLASLPRSVGWGQMLGVGILAGVGFTVALFVNDLAFEEAVLLDRGKIGILLGSIVAGLIGYFALRALTSRDQNAPEEDSTQPPTSEVSTGLPSL